MTRNTAIAATAAAGLLCGCPGLFACLFGAISATASFVPGAEIDMFGSSDPASALVSGLVAICGGIVLVAIPVAVGYFTLRNRPAA